MNHETHLDLLSDEIINKVNQNISHNNKELIQACILGLNTIAGQSQLAFKALTSKLTGLPIATEGSLLALIYILLHSTENIEQVQELICRYSAIAKSTTETETVRISCIHLLSVLSLVPAVDCNSVVIECIEPLLSGDLAFSQNLMLYSIAAKLFNPQIEIHNMFLKEISKRELMNLSSVDEKARINSIRFYKTFSSQLSYNDKLLAIIKLLADESETV